MCLKDPKSSGWSDASARPTAIVDAVSLLALRMQRGIGDATARRIIVAAKEHHTPLEGLFGLPLSRLSQRFPGAQARALAACDGAAVAQAQRQIDNARDSAIHVIPLDAPHYPPALSNAMGEAAPVLLFAQGELGLLSLPGAAVVGRRTPSADGVQLAVATARRLAAEGTLVVSGGAAGVDSAAHQAALEAGGGTVVVLPQGIFTYHPPGHLRSAVAEGRALFLSAFPPEDRWRTPLAVMRNEIISALADVVYVVEPGRPGGSQLTGMHGLRRHKPVYCRPCPGRPSPYDPALEIPSPFAGYLAYRLPPCESPVPKQQRFL